MFLLLHGSVGALLLCCTLDFTQNCHQDAGLNEANMNSLVRNPSAQPEDYVCGAALFPLSILYLERVMGETTDCAPDVSPSLALLQLGLSQLLLLLWRH